MIYELLSKIKNIFLFWHYNFESLVICILRLAQIFNKLEIIANERISHLCVNLNHQPWNQKKDTFHGRGRHFVTRFVTLSSKYLGVTWSQKKLLKVNY